MKTIKGFKMRQVCGEYVVLAEGAKIAQFNKIIHLNATAAYLWEGIEDGKEFTVDTLAERLVEKYDVDIEKSRTDAEKLVSDWKDKAGIIED